MITKHFKRLGVSLVEQVGIVTVIGILAAMTLPWVDRLNLPMPKGQGILGADRYYGW